MKQTLYLSRFLITLLFCGISYANAQNNNVFDNYKPVVCEGPIPPLFRIKASEHSENKKNEIVKSQDKAKVKKEKEEFAVKSAFFIDAMLNSGKVLFGDTLTRYVNAVANELLKAEPQLQGKLQFYVVQSPVVNAFATDMGVVFVNIGLLAQIENEAQLAFVLAHEIAHYRKSHSLTKYAEHQKAAKSQGAYRNNSVADKLISIHSFSRELETEADEMGVDLILKSKYASEVSGSLFDVLLYSHLPFDEVVFDLNFFKAEHCSLPQSCMTDSVPEIKVDEDEDDKESTHPNVKTRKETVAKKLEGQNNKGSLYVLPEAHFRHVQTIARFELSRLYLLTHKYEQAIYNAYLTLQKQPSRYQEKVIARSLYGLAVYACNGQLGETHLNYSDIEGEMHRIPYLIDNLSNSELTILALHYSLKYQKNHPDDKELEPIIRELGLRLTERGEIKLRDLSTSPPSPELVAKENAKDSAKTVEKVPETTVGKKTTESKVDKIKKKKDVKEKIEGPRYEKYALVDYMNDPTLKNALADGDKMRQKREAKEKDEKSGKKKEKIAPQYYPVGGGYASVDQPINKMVVVSPECFKVDERKQNEVKLVDSEELRDQFIDILNEACEKNSMDAEVVSLKMMNEGDVKKFNQMAMIKRYYGERFMHEIDSLQPVEYAELQKAVDDFKTPYFTLMVVNSSRVRKSIGFHISNIIMCHFLITSPIAIVRWVTPRYKTTFYTLALDARSGQIVYGSSSKVDMNKSKDVLQMFTYDSIYTLKHLKRPAKFKSATQTNTRYE